MEWFALLKPSSWDPSRANPRTIPSGRNATPALVYPSARHIEQAKPTESHGRSRHCRKQGFLSDAGYEEPGKRTRPEPMAHRGAHRETSKPPGPGTKMSAVRSGRLARGQPTKPPVNVAGWTGLDWHGGGSWKAGKRGCREPNRAEGSHRDCQG